MTKISFLTKNVFRSKTDTDYNNGQIIDSQNDNNDQNVFNIQNVSIADN